jgi:hypothetical protein
MRLTVCEVKHQLAESVVVNLREFRTAIVDGWKENAPDMNLHEAASGSRHTQKRTRTNGRMTSKRAEHFRLPKTFSSG